MRIGIGSKNPTKVKAVEEMAFTLGAWVEAFEVPSKVSPQPLSDEETQRGALERARGCLDFGVDIGMGLEGGVEMEGDKLYLTSFGALVDSQGLSFTCKAPRILMPSCFIPALLQGRELSTLMEEFSKIENIHQKEGAVGIFTKGLISRKELFGYLCKILMGQYLYTTCPK